MSIPSEPAATASVPAAATLPATDAAGAGSAAVAGKLDGQQVQLVSSGQSREEVAERRIGELDRARLLEPATHGQRTTKKGRTTSLDKRLKLALRNLDAHHNPSILARKIQSLARVISRLFTRTHANAAARPQAAAANPYEKLAVRIEKTAGGKPAGAAQANIALLNEFHRASGSIPEVARQISSDGQVVLAANLARLAGPMDRLVSTAAALEHLQGDGIRSALNSAPDFRVRPGADEQAAGMKRETIKLNVKSVARRLAAVVSEPYTPQNPKLREVVDRMPEGATRFGQFGNCENNPYQALSRSEHFTEADDRHLRNWLGQALAMVSSCARAIDAAVIDNDTRLDSAGLDISQLRRVSDSPIQGLETAV